MSNLGKVLTDLGIALKDDNGRYKDIFDILDELSNAWQKIDD